MVTLSAISRRDYAKSANIRRTSIQYKWAIPVSCPHLLGDQLESLDQQMGPGDWKDWVRSKTATGLDQHRPILIGTGLSKSSEAYGVMPRTES